MQDFFIFPSSSSSSSDSRPVSEFKRRCPPMWLWVLRYFGVLWVDNLVTSLGV
jgi:hypothetical protein